MGSERALDGQAALVTGGGGGIGGASAEWLARDGAAVMIMGRTEATLVESKKRIEKAAGAGARIEYFVGDAVDESAVEAACAATAALADRLAIAVSVVGGGTMKPLLMFTGDELADDLRKNIVSAFLIIKYGIKLRVQANLRAPIRRPFRKARGSSGLRILRLWRGASCDS